MVNNYNISQAFAVSHLKVEDVTTLRI